jgi:hypothetical protein
MFFLVLLVDCNGKFYKNKYKNVKSVCLGFCWVYSFLPGTNTATATAVVQSPFLSPTAVVLKVHVFCGMLVSSATVET